MACTRRNIPHVPCAAHTLNLIVQKGLLPAEHLIARVKRIINFFTSPKQGERLAAVQTSFSEQERKNKDRKQKGKSRVDADEVGELIDRSIDRSVRIVSQRFFL